MIIFGISLERITRGEVLGRVEKSIREKSLLRIATVNPEFLLKARESEVFKKSLQKADIRTTDGAGLALMANIFGVHLPRVTGADLVPALLTLAEKNNIPVVIFNKENSLSSSNLIQTVLQKKYPKLTILFNQAPAQYSFVFCTYGAPTQEIFLAQQQAASLYLGVGGALDYLTGKQTRAPRALQSLGLEWLWRLFLQPRRLHRIWRAALVFPLRFLSEKMLH
jgi:N-acetylglucosaminyldiphosphoundecaprenol N-acetyl-beta-D-mannosaminyltransferase